MCVLSDSHPNIISYKEYFEVSAPPSQHVAGPWNAAAWKGAQPGARGGGAASTLYIIMSYAEGGDLESRIKAQQALGQQQRRFCPFPEQQIIDWFLQTALALKHIHDRKILHRDIKTQNIFLTKMNLVKLGDFGIAKDLATTMAKALTQIGTPFSLSPEICQEQPYDNKSDVWALGVVLYEMMCLTHPFNGTTMKQLIMNIVRAKYTPPPAGVYSKPLCDLLGFLLQRSPKARPSINQLLRFPFIQQHIGRFLSSHKIQEEFSHTILHGGAAGSLLAAGRAAMVPQQPPQPLLQAKNAVEAHAQAQLLAAQQQQQQEADRARDAQHRAALIAQQQAQAQAQAAAQQQKALAIQRAKMLAVQEAERARQAQAAMLRAQAEAAAAQRQKAEAAAEAKLRQQREAMQKEKEKQMARDAANRREAQRRADERAKQDAREREQMREAKLERDRDRAEAACLVPPPRRAQAGARVSPARPPWVGVIDEPAAGAATAVDGDSSIDGPHSHRGAQHDHNRESGASDREQEQQQQQREREREQREHERERERQQREQYGRERGREHRHRQQLLQQQQQQQQQQQAAGRPQQQPPQLRQRHSSERSAAPDGFAPTMVRPSPRDPRGELQFRQQQLHHLQQQQQQQACPSMQRASSVAELNSNRSDAHNGSGGGGGGMESRSEKAAKQRAHEEQLALARKAYFEERKLLERRQKNLMDEGAGVAAVVGEGGAAANRDDMPVGGGGAGRGMNRAASEAVFDRPSSAAGLRKQQQQQRESVPPLEQAFPPRNAAAAAGAAGRKGSAPSQPAPSSSPPPSAAAAPAARRSDDKPLSKAEAMAAKEEELARLRIEYFEERKQLQARKQKQLEEAGLVPVSTSPPAAKPAPAVVAAVAAAPHPAPAVVADASAPKATAKASRAEQLARDRALYFQQQRQKVAADSPEVTMLHGHEPHLPSRASGGSGSAHSSPPSSPAAPVDVESGSSSGADDDSGVVVGVQASRASVAHEAEACIDELASNTHSCEEMLQLMATMREVVKPRDNAAAAAANSRKASRAASPTSASADDTTDASDDLSVEIDEEEDYQIPPATDPATETDDDELGEDDSTEVTELRGAVSDLSMSGQFSIDPAVLSEHAGSEGGESLDGESDGEGESIEPATEAEENAQDEFEEHCADEMRDAVAQALKQKTDDDDDRAAERPDEAADSEDHPHSADDSVDVDLHASAARASSGSRSPTGQSGLYNASATLPPHRIPVITASGGSHYLAAPTSGPTVSSAHPPLHPAHAQAESSGPAASSAVLSTTQSFPNGLLGSLPAAPAAPAPAAPAASASTSPDPSSYKVESLRQFLSEKLGDDLLLEIYRLLRRNLAHQGSDPPVTTVYSHDGSASAQASPNTTMSAAQIAAASAAGGGLQSARRGSMSSLMVGNVNIRELLYGSGLLAGQTKYISLIQQLIQAEQQLYGQL